MAFRKRISYIVKLLIIFILFDSLVSLSWSKYVLSAIEDEERQERFDVVLILMGDFNEDFSDLGEETKRRLNFAVSLKDKYPIGTFLCLGGSRPRSNIIGAELMKGYPERHGVSSSNVLADGKSFDTFGNWKDARKRIEDNHWQHVGIISSGFHLFRMKKYILDTPDHFELSLLPFSYQNASPRISIFELWKSVHYEWITYTIYFLPKPFYDSIVSLIRPQ